MSDDGRLPPSNLISDSTFRTTPRLSTVKVRSRPRRGSRRSLKAQTRLQARCQLSERSRSPAGSIGVLASSAQRGEGFRRLRGAISRSLLGNASANCQGAFGRAASWSIITSVSQRSIAGSKAASSKPFMMATLAPMAARFSCTCPRARHSRDADLRKLRDAITQASSVFEAMRFSASLRLLATGFCSKVVSDPDCLKVQQSARRVLPSIPGVSVYYVSP
jgi:hypothetical protein